MQTPLESVQYSEIFRQWNDALYQVKSALATSDLAAYNNAIATRDLMLTKLKQIEQAAFVSPEAAQSVDLASFG